MAPPPPQLVSLASEVQDLHLAQRKEMASGFSKGPSLGLLPDVPSLMETLSYSYCYVGIMTGERGPPPRACLPAPRHPLSPFRTPSLVSVRCSCLRAGICCSEGECRGLALAHTRTGRPE